MVERAANLDRAGDYPDDGDRFADAADTLGASPERRKFVLQPFREIAFSAGAEWLVKGLLASTGLATIYGAPKQYKSFVALHLAMNVADGRPWAGRRVRQGIVVYIVGEGATGFSNRVAANRLQGRFPDDLPFYLIRARPNLGAGEGDRADLVASIEAVVGKRQIAAIFVDTLVRTLAGASENDEGMRNFTDNGEAIADYFGCLVCAVHHTGKDAARGMRGSSALDGAVVNAWKVEKGKDFQARVTLEYAKDGESGLTWTVDLDRYVYGRDEDGDEQSVLVVSDLSEPVPEGKAAQPPSASRSRVPPQLALFMQCLDQAMGASGRPEKPLPDGPTIRVVSVESVRAEYYARRGDTTEPDTKRRSFNNSLKAGLDRRLILVEGDEADKVVWRAKVDPAQP